MSGLRRPVLVVDDDPNNLRILKLDLEDQFQVLTAADGLQACSLMEERGEEISTILLDRMMPGLNGIQFMQRMKADSRFRDLPVIMQTAAASPEQVIQGIEAGVYYYLTKPYEKEVMLALVRAASDEYEKYRQLRSALIDAQVSAELLKECCLEARTLDDVNHLVIFLSQIFPDPDRAVLGVRELLLNALEHGNLGITYAEKSALNQEGRWRSEVLRRQELPEHLDKRIFIEYRNLGDRMTLRIRDQGNGFDWNDFLTICPERAMDSHGRGIALARLGSFDEVEFMGKGNEVVCTVYTPAQDDSAKDDVEPPL